MPGTLEQLKAECAGLSDKERAELAYFLLHSLDSEEDPDAEAAWKEEVRRRMAEIRSGQVTGKPAEQVFAKVREKYS
jgi:putative addiction module component (TIGR02574 family)